MAPAETPSGFLRIAQRDLRAANGMVDATLFYEEHWGFQIQQATEKALKETLIKSRSSLQGGLNLIHETAARDDSASLPL